TIPRTGLWAQLTAGPVTFQSRVRFWGNLRFGGGFRLTQPVAITAAKFCTIDGPFETAFILRTVEFDVLMHNYERINGKTKGVANRPMPGLAITPSACGSSAFWRPARRSRERPGSLRSTITRCAGIGGTTFRLKPGPPMWREPERAKTSSR